MHAAMMADLRHRILPPTFLSRYPKEAGFCLWLLHPEPSSRPTARYLAECYSEMNHVGNIFTRSGTKENVWTLDKIFFYH